MLHFSNIYFFALFFIEISSKDLRGNYFKIIGDIAEFFSLKFVVLAIPSGTVFQYDSHFGDLANFRTNYYFSVLEMHKLEFVKSEEHKTLVVFNRNVDEWDRYRFDFKVVREYYRATWLVFGADYAEFDYVPYNTLFIVASKIGDRFVLKEFYQFSVNSTMYSQILGTWTANETFRMANGNFFNRRSNFFQEYVLLKPTKKDGSKSANSNMPDFIPGIWDSIEKRLNASSKPHMDDSTCDVNANFVLSHDVQYLPVMKEVKSVLFFKEITTKFSFTRYFDPFSLDIWLAMLLWICLSALVMSAINACSVLLTENLSFFLLDAFYIFLQQGSQITKNTFTFLSVKTVQLGLSLFIFICYGSVLISCITVTVSKPPFKTLDEILEHGRYNILTLPGKGYGAFQHGPGIVQKLFVKHVSPIENQPKNFFEAFKRVCNGEDVLAECAFEYGPILAQSVPHPCKVKNVPFTILKQGYQTSRRSPFKEIFKVCITKLIESGAVGKIYWSKAIMIKDPIQEEEVLSLSIVEVSSVLIMFSIGLLISVFIFLMERIAWKRMNQRNCSLSFCVL